MAIIKTCENCVYGKNKKSFFATCEEEDVSYCYHFIPKEEVVREDERNKTIDNLLNIFFCKYGNAENIPVKEILEIIKEEIGRNNK